MGWILPRLQPAARALALAALAGHALHSGLGVGGRALEEFFDRWVYDGLLLLSAGFCLARAIARREERLTWWAFAAAILAWTIGEILYTALSGPLDEPSFPSVADAFYLAFYPLAYAGLVSLMRVRDRWFAACMWLDGFVASAAVAAVGAAVLFEVVLGSTGGTTAEVAVNLAYPLGDILLFALVVAAFTLTGWRPGREWALLGAGLGALAVADGLYLFQAATDSYREGTILDSLWLASAVALAAASWQEPSRARPVTLERPPVAVPTVFAATAVGMLGLDHFRPLNTLAVALALVTLAGVLWRTAFTFRQNGNLLARLRRQAVTDELTGLSNRRKLLADLERALEEPRPGGRLLLLLFDLDGFKRYNDTFGHPAGDPLLRRLGGALADAADGRGTSYRLGGDEFCVLARVPPEGAAELVDACVAALAERSEGFTIGTSFGAVLLPDEAATPAEALRRADQRLFAQKRERRIAAGREPQDVLLRALYERDPSLREHARLVSILAVAVGRRVRLRAGDLTGVARAAELHDIGKLALPDGLLHKTGSLDQDELRFLQQHPAVGERILGASPELAPVARLVRSAHERWDGGGYPDGLAGEEIPAAARVIAACDAFAAMISPREHRPPLGFDEALAELRLGAGTSFDPAVVEAFEGLVRSEPEFLEALRRPDALAA